jgi:hypothetical protein
MTDNVKPLFAGQRTGTEPVPELVELLTAVLAQAKSGEVQTLAFVGTCADNGVVSGICGDGDIFTLIGALRVVETRLISQVEM